MRESKVHNINGTNYTIQMLGAKVGKSLLARMLRMFGPAIEAEDTMTRLCAALTDTDLDFLCDTFAATTMVELGPDRLVPLKGVFEDHFAGKYGDMVKWLWASVETNYGTFLADVGLSPDKLQAAMAQAMMGATQAPITPSGASSPKTGGG